MERLNCIAAALAAVVPAPAFADIGVPSAATMIDAAAVIVVGSVAPTTPPSILPSLVLKGAAVAGRRLVLADPTGGQFLSFSLDRVPAIVGTATTVALGRLDADARVLSLVWLNASLWPEGYRHDTYTSDGLDNVVAFVRRVLGYSALAAKDANAALATVLQDLDQGRAEAPLAWLEVAVERDFGAAAAGIRAAAAAAVLAGPPLGAAAARQFADTAQAYPVTLAAPILLGLSTGPAAPRAQPALRAMLTARGATLDRAADAAAMRAAWQALPSGVRRADARRLLALIDAPWPVLSGPRSDATLEAVVGSRPAQLAPSLPPEPRKALWNTQIESMLD